MFFTDLDEFRYLFRLHFGHLEGPELGPEVHQRDPAGDRQRGEPEGSGRIIFAKGGVFDGSFEEGRFEFEVDSGEVSERGQFRDGFLDGRGRRAFGREVYEGEFKCSLYHGAGVLRMEVIGVSARHG